MVRMRYGVLLVGCVLALGCDSDEKPNEATVATASQAAPVPTPTLAPKPEAGPPPKKEKVCADEAVVDFDGDEVLEAQVRLKLSKPEGDIKKTDLKRVRSLNLSQGKTDELDPCIFPLLTGLKELFLGPGKLEDLSPIAELTGLVALRASLNKVSDITPLAKMTQMDRLDLGHTRVQDISALSEMTELTDLQLDDTPVSDLGPLSKMEKLERLSIQRTAVKDIGPLKGLESLKFVYVNGAPIDNPFMLGKSVKVIDQ